MSLVRDLPRTRFVRVFFRLIKMCRVGVLGSREGEAPAEEYLLSLPPGECRAQRGRGEAFPDFCSC